HQTTTIMLKTYVKIEGHANWFLAVTPEMGMTTQKLKEVPNVYLHPALKYVDIPYSDFASRYEDEIVVVRPTGSWMTIPSLDEAIEIKIFEGFPN
ncbi:unnamed protein product, partial [marine sediment metagenome]